MNSGEFIQQLRIQMSAKVEQFKAQIATTEEVCSQLKLYLAWVNELQKSDVPAAIKLCQEAITLALQPENAGQCAQELAQCLFHLGSLNIRNGNFLEAISIIYDAMPQIENLHDSYLQARAINVLAVANGYLGNYYEALQHFLKALEIFQTIGDRSWEAAVLNNIGFQYWHLENYNWAFKYLDMSLVLAEKLDDKSLEGDVCETLCNVYHAKGEHQQALSFGLRSMALYRELEDGHAESEVLNSIGDSYLALGQEEQALTHFNRALKLSLETGHKYEEVETLLRLGKYHAAHGSLEESQDTLKQALNRAEKLEAKRSIFECYRALYEVMKKSGNFEGALLHYEQFFHYYKQVFDENESLRIQSLEIMHQVDSARKDAEIYRLRSVALQSEIDERKRAQEALRKLATTDPLTGLFNRRYFFELAEEAYHKISLTRPNLSVILIDVDNFKSINDLYGHRVGDEVLVKLANIMQAGVRKFDIVARYGGEEFVILLPDTSKKQAREIAERLRSSVVAQPICVKEFEIRLGISVGVAFFEKHNEMDIETLVNRADISMYEAKQAGGNRVHIWGTGLI